MGEEKIRTILRDFGLTEKEADIYIFLAKHNAMSRGDIARLLRKDKAQISRILKKIQNKGVVEATLEYPRRFTAIPFETIINSSIKTKRDEAASIEEARKDLLRYLESNKKAGFGLLIEKFSVIEQNQKIYSKISEMIDKTKKQLSAITTVSSLIQDTQFGLLDFTINHPSESKIQLCFLTELSNQNLKAVKTLLKKTTQSRFTIRGRNPDLGLRLFPQMVIRDNEEILLFITSKTDNSYAGQNEVALWTNCKSIVNSFSCVFDELWRNSTDLQEKITRLETHKPEPIQFAAIPKTLDEKYKKTLSLAKKEIIMITSAANLNTFWKSLPQTKEWIKRNVSVKIMAPITKNNSNVVQLLSKFCEVRHVGAGNLETTVVDGKQLFQHKIQPLDQEGLKQTTPFEDAFYSDDLEYVSKVKSMLDDLWNNAPAPSTITLDTSIQTLSTSCNNLSNDSYTLSKPDSPYRKLAIPFEEKPRLVAEEEVINKIINAKKQNQKTDITGKAVFYGSRASAVIHPPKYLNLPEMIISVACWNEKSSFGPENWLTINLWIDTPKGKAFLPVVIVQNNSAGLDLRKQIYIGTPAAKNTQIIKKDEFQVQVHGNILFAGWTKPIPLLPPKNSIPPSCILFEGYGEVKPGVINSGFPSGRKQNWEYNGLEAFVTFFHPSAKYSGPGTDGTFSREVILTSYPP